MAWIIETPGQSSGKRWAISDAPKETETPPSEQKTMPWGEAVSSGLRNFPASAGNMAVAAGKAMLHPVDTIQGLGKLAAGVSNFVTPGETSASALIWQQALGLGGADQALKEVVKPYSSVENLKETVATDPAVPVADLFTLLGAGGSALAKAPGLAGKIGEAAQIPGRAAMRAPGKAVSGVMDALGKKLYGGSVSFPESTGFAGKRAAIEVGSGPAALSTSEKGVVKLQNRIGGLSQELDDVLARAGDAGLKQGILEFWGQLDEMKKGADLGVDPIKLEMAVDAKINQYLDHAAKTGRTNYSPAELNALKRALAQEVKYSSAPGMNTSSSAARVNAAAAKNARRALEAMDPNINRLNSELAPLMDLRDPLYSSAFKAKLTSDHPIIAGSLGRAIGGTSLGIPAMLFGPNLASQAGISSRAVARSPLLKALLGEAPAGAYYSQRGSRKED